MRHSIKKMALAMTLLVVMVAGTAPTTAFAQPGGAPELGGAEAHHVTIRVTGTPGVSFAPVNYCAIECDELPGGVTPQDYEVEVEAGDSEFVTANTGAHLDAGQELTLQIVEEDGQVVQEQSTTEEFGVVQVTYPPLP